MAGHSLGEYSALVLQRRTRFCRCDQTGRAAWPGHAGSRTGRHRRHGCHHRSGQRIHRRQLREKAAQGQVVSPVNFNSPGQVVIAGHKEAVERANVLMKESGAKRALPLPVSVPSHCALMKPAAEKLAAALDGIFEIKVQPSRSSIMSTYPVNRIRPPSSKRWYVSCSARFVGPRLSSGWPMRALPSRSRWDRAKC
ncbi:ACP S-malonyltransferase [Escherichia coli]